MAFNGSGVFNRIYSWVTDRNNGVKIDATRMDAEMDGMATGLSTCVTKDGQTTITANLPMAGFRHTGVGNASARTDYAATGQVQDGSFIYVGTVGGTADAITLTPSPAITAYAAGQTFRFIASGANTGATTVNVSAVGAKSITKNGTTALDSGDIPSGAIVEIVYDGTQFQITKIKQGTASTIDTPVSHDKGGTGQTSYTNGQLLIGNTTGNTLTKATLTAGNGITVTNGTGSISLAANLSAGTGITVTPGAATSIAVTTPVSAANGCSLTLVQTQAASASASITFSSLSADTYYVLKFRLVKSANDKLNVRVNADATVNRHGKAGDTQDETATETIEGYANGTELAVEGPSGAASEFISGTVEFVTRPSDNTQTHLNYNTCTSGNTATITVNSQGAGKYNGTALSSIVVFPGSGTITGSISLYSVKAA